MKKNIFQESTYIYNLIKSLKLTERQEKALFVAIYDLVDAITGVNMSHNVCCENSQIFLVKCCNYLIWQGKEVTPCNNLTTAINIAKETKKIATIFESISSKGRYWKYMCDVSHGIFNKESVM